MRARLIGLGCLALISACRERQAEQPPETTQVIAPLSSEEQPASYPRTEEPMGVPSPTAAPTPVPVSQAPAPGYHSNAASGAATGGNPASNEQRCCCQATGHPLAMIGMSECNKTRRGVCVKQSQCTSSTSGSSAQPPGGGQSCCCSAPGQSNPSVQLMSRCNKTLKGSCIKMTQCKSKPRAPSLEF